MRRGFVITGIDTNVGKTVVSAIVAQALQSSYWKPVQCGDLNNSDSARVKDLTDGVTVLPEAFRLALPQSPHAAAKAEGVTIRMENLEIPNSDGPIIVEGAGGVMVPLNDDGLTYLDVFKEWNLPVIIVSKHYLGSINHTLMTVQVLRDRQVNIEGIIFIGEESHASAEIIRSITRLPVLATIPVVECPDAAFVQDQAKKIHLNYGRFDQT